MWDSSSRKNTCHAAAVLEFYNHLLGYPIVGCRLLITRPMSRIRNCPTMEAKKILHPSVNLSNISCSNIGRMHQVEAAPLLVVA